jgi:polysaccharide deacetylase family protein (PEP-CTERM system associated)
VLEAFAANGVRGTFFVLGLAARKAPHIVRAISDAGHEIQSHGYGHRNNFELTAEQFRQDILQAKGLLEDLTGQEIYAYRAPCFTIDERNLWALDVLVETGHRYDSSIFPLKTSRYGIDGYPPQPQVVTTPNGGRIVEAPVACFDWLGRRCPAGGGGYFRLLPYWLIRRAWAQLERLARPGIVYMHPYEYDPVEMSVYNVSVPLSQRLHQGIGRKGFPGKIDRLLREFRFGPMRQVLAPWLEEIHEDRHPDH